MHRFTQFLAVMLTGLGLWLGGSAAQGMVAMPPPGPVRIAHADAVVVGTVVALEPQDIKVDKMTYRIAVVKINQALSGSKDAKTLRIAFVPLPQPVEGNKGPRVISLGGRPLQLRPGQEGLFILKKHAKEDFYTLPGIVGYYINSENNKDFDKEVQVAKVIARVNENPKAGLSAKDAAERLVAASILIDKYRTFRGPTSKQEPIDAEESKQIMQALADADWQAARNFTFLGPTAPQLFQMLGISAKDGFTVPAGGNYQTAAQAWLRNNVQTYRIKRFVAGNEK